MLVYQHQDIKENVKKILRLINQEQSTKSKEIFNSLSKLSQKLDDHLVLEDDALYPILFNYRDPHIKEIAKQFIKEMGDFHDTFIAYTNEWNTPHSLEDHFSVFHEQTSNILSKLIKRKEKEDNELFTLLKMNIH